MSSEYDNQLMRCTKQYVKPLSRSGCLEYARYWCTSSTVILIVMPRQRYALPCVSLGVTFKGWMDNCFFWEYSAWGQDPWWAQPAASDISREGLAGSGPGGIRFGWIGVPNGGRMVGKTLNKIRTKILQSDDTPSTTSTIHQPPAQVDHSLKYPAAPMTCTS